MKHLVVTTLLVLMLCLASEPMASERFRFDGVERVVAFGDIHGDYEVLTTVLKGAGVVDDELNWQGGRTHLVSTGDLIDRGDYGRQVLELLMRLEGEAASAGGKVHVLLGNHEAMVLSGDLRYVSAGDFDQYGGRAAHRAAFAPDGAIGSWLLGKPVMIVINGTAFAHGGLSSHLAGLTLEQINDNAQRDLRTVVEGWHALLASGELHEEANFTAIRTALVGLSPALAGLPFVRTGPLWYRGSSLCHPFTETDVVRSVLSSLGAERIAVGHTITRDRRMSTRLGGRVIRMDTGMNSEFYQGRPAALVIEGSSLSAFYADEGVAALVEEPSRIWDRPHGMSDKEIEEVLTGSVVVQREAIAGTNRELLKLATGTGGPQLAATFSTDPSGRHRYSVAAYKLDRMMGLEMVPVSVVRAVDGIEGALTLWIDGAMDEAERKRREVPFGGFCEFEAMNNFMRVFDLLIANPARDLIDILFDPRTSNLWWVGHVDAFGTNQDMQYTGITITPEMDAALRLVTHDRVAPLLTYLDRQQVQALVERARHLRRMNLR